MSFQVAAPIASSSKQDPGPASGPDTPHQRLLDQRDILDRLAEGEGIPMDEWNGLVEKCYVCKKFMLEAVFKAHNRDCWFDVRVPDDVETEVDEWGKE